MKVSEILNGAADLIDARGWAQRDFVDDKGCLCMVGAVRAVEILRQRESTSVVTDGDIEDWYSAESSEAESILDRELGGDVLRWNDAAGRTEEEVVSMLREIAAGVDE